MHPTLITAVDSSPRWTDVWTAWGTVALAGATLLLATVTVGVYFADRVRSNKILRSDRRRAEADRRTAMRRLQDERTQAAERLHEEREIAERRLSAEREWAATQRRRERQIEAAGELLEYMADLPGWLVWIPGASLPHGAFPGGEYSMAAVETMRGLQRGAWTAAMKLDHPEGAERYRNLVHLVLTVAKHAPSDHRDRDVHDLRNYTRWVRITLRELINTGDVPHIDDHERIPKLDRKNDIPWFPSNPVPPGWHEDIETDDADVRFRAADSADALTDPIAGL